MDGMEVGRKLVAMVALCAIAATVLVIAPSEIRLIVALVTLPIGALALAVILANADRRIPQP